MKSSIFATIAGIALANTGLRGDCCDDDNGYTDGTGGIVRTSTSTSYSSSSSTTGAGGLSTYLPVNQVGGGSRAKLSGVSDLVITSGGLSTGGGLGGAYGLSGAGGSGSVVITSANTGASNVVSGKIITDGKFPTADLNVITGGNRNVNSNVVAAGVINNAYANIARGSSVDLDSVFTRLPSLRDIDNLILSSDSVAILKTIQTVATENSLTCDQRIAYLLELLGRVKAAVEKKVFAAGQLKIVVDGASAEIIRLQRLIDANNAEIGKINIPALKTKLDALVADLQRAYADFNKI